MSPRLPPRREPRSLALVRSPTGFSFAVADPWEIRSAGSVHCHALSLGPAVARVIRREKPTVVVTRDSDLRGPVERAARRFGIANAGKNLPLLPRPIASDLYPELLMRAPSSSLTKTAVLAVAAVLYAETTPRHYAPRRQSSIEHASCA